MEKKMKNDLPKIPEDKIMLYKGKYWVRGIVTITGMILCLISGIVFGVFSLLGYING
jgi:hypothetical protein